MLFGCLLPFAALGLVTKAWRHVLSAAIAGGSLLVFYIFPIHATGYEWRFLYPVLPFGVALVGLGVGRLCSWWGAPSRSSRVLRWVTAAAAAVLFALGMFNITNRTNAQLRLYHWDGAASNRVREDFGRYLAAFDPPAGKHVLAMRDSGATPYYSGWRTIDFFSLNDNHIAITRDRDPDYVLSFKPDIVIITNGGNRSLAPQFPDDGPLYRAAYHRGLRRIISLQVTPRYFYWVLIKPKSRLAGYVRAWHQIPLPPRPPAAGNNPILGA
jgi:hypothetical protein